MTFRACVALCAIAAGVTTLDAQPSRLTAAQIKAAYLYSFGKFVSWPADAPETMGAFPICVLGSDPFGRDLDEVLRSATVSGRPALPRRLSDARDAGACRVLFVSASEEARVRAVLAQLEHAPVLTVSDLPDFTARGGMIGFVADGNRIRFSINLTSAQAAGLTLSSDLLRVAMAVRK